MKLAFIFILLFIASGYAMDDVDHKVDAILKQMTLAEKIELLGGQDNFYTKPIPRLNIPSFKMADGPMGVRNYGAGTAMAGGIALAASWNRELAEQVASQIAKDARSKGVHFLLAPGVNIYRSPLNGRNFEYFGEDPFLASQIAVSYIKGVQKNGVSATVKHFIANNSEYARHTTDAIIDERTMREIYLPAFEAAVKEAHVGAIMDAYNLVNGAHASENGRLNIDIAEKEWGFDGLIMSDWISTYDTLGITKGGLDLEMPSAVYFNKARLLPLLKDGKITEEMINDKIRRFLRTAIRFGWLEHPQTDYTTTSINWDNKQTALQSAREGMVLLKNENHLLPLDQKAIKTVAVIGPNANPAVTGGGGSSFVHSLHPVSFLDGVSQFAKTVTSSGIPSLADLSQNTNFQSLKAQYFDNPDLSGNPFLVRDEQHINHAEFPESTQSSRWVGTFTPQTSSDYVFFVETMNEPSGFYRLYVDNQLIFDDWTKSKALLNFKTLPLTAKPHKIILEQHGHVLNHESRFKFGIVAKEKLIKPEALKLAAEADIVVVPVGFNAASESEGSDRTFQLPFGQDELISQLLEVNKNVIVVIISGGSVNMSSWIDHVPAIIQAWYPGEQGGTALAEILFGKINPSGKLPVTFEKRWEDNPTFNSYYPENEKTNQVRYKEGLFVGYRGYEQRHTTPQFPFGFGLSYTTFHYSDLSFKHLNDQNYQVSFTLSNTGKVPGAEIAQVYVKQENPGISRPNKELKGFVKVMLQPGESKTVSVLLNHRSFAYYDVSAKDWIVPQGTYEILVGASSQQILLKQQLGIDSDAFR